jgi:hypothetical protein
MQISVAKTVAVLVAAVLFSSRSSGQIQNPITAARDAYNKARQQQQQQQQQQKQQQQQQKQQTRPDQAPQAGATPRPVAAPDVAEPWTPPADTPTAPPVVLDPSKMPDVVGVRLGMSPQEALEALRKQYPKDIYQKLTADWWPAPQKPDYGFTVLSSAPGNTADAHLSLTAPPNPQLVWRITRLTQRMHINRVTFLAALREKYGKETVAYPENGGGDPVTDDRRMGELAWLFDESGGRAPLPRAAAVSGAPNLVQCLSGPGNPQPIMPVDDVDLTKTKFRDWCSSVVGIHINIGSQEIVENTFTEMLDAPLAIRTAHAAAVWQRDLAERLRREDLERSKKAKPVL